MAASIVPSLLQAIVIMDGESLVMHVGDPPYVVTEGGQVTLAKTPLTMTSMLGLMEELVPPASRRALEENGATQFVLDEHPLLPTERFIVVAAMGATEAWVEIRRATERMTAHPAFGRAADAPDRASAQPVIPVDRRGTEASRPSVILPLARQSIRQEGAPPRPDAARAGIDHLLRLAMARGASTLYLSSGARPALRVDGEIEPLEGVPLLDARQVEALLLTLTPERTAEALRQRAAGEWTSEIDGVGRVRCQSYRDHRGPGGVLRLIPARVPTADQLGLSRELLGLVGGSDGLVVVAGPRASGKRTLMSAFVDHIARTRRVHIITLERDVMVAHAPAHGLVSQREVVRPADMPAAVRAALREDPDVLMIEDIRSAALVDLALDTAAPGRLVICGCAARSAAAAVDRIIDLAPPSTRARVQLALAHTLRGVVAQVLVRKVGGGRVAVRELLLNTSAVASLLAEGRTAQLPSAIEGGRAVGMLPLNEALAAVVENGTVDVRVACGAAADRDGLLTLLERRGVDVSQVQRLG